MSGRDLRGYISQLDDAGQLARIGRPVSQIHELADVAAALARNDIGAGLFENVIDSPWPIFAGSVTSHRRAAIAIGCEPDEIIDRMGDAMELSNGVPTVATDTDTSQRFSVSLKIRCSDPGFSCRRHPAPDREMPS